MISFKPPEKHTSLSWPPLLKGYYYTIDSTGLNTAATISLFSLLINDDEEFIISVYDFN